MKYSEARRILEKNGMELEKNGTGGNTYIAHNGIAFMVIPKKHMYIANSLRDNTGATSHQLDIAQKVAYKLSRTKPEDREDTKKYYLEIPNLPVSLKNVYINKDLDVAGRFLLLDNKETPDCQTLFTDDEIKQMQQDPTFANVDLEKWKVETLPFYQEGKS